VVVAVFVNDQRTAERNGGGVAEDALGNLFIAEPVTNRIWEVSADGVINRRIDAKAKGGDCIPQ
jgi:hypothetical protein